MTRCQFVCFTIACAVMLITAVYMYMHNSQVYNAPIVIYNPELHRAQYTAEYQEQLRRYYLNWIYKRRVI